MSLDLFSVFVQICVLYILYCLFTHVICHLRKKNTVNN